MISNLGWSLNYVGSVPRSQDTKPVGLEQNYTWVRNSHQFEFGWRYRRQALDVLPDQPAQSVINFNSLATALYDPATGSTPGAVPRTGYDGANFFLGVAGMYQQTLPPGRCFWLLLTSGFRTYRFLPVFWREFFPRFDAPTPAGMARLLHELASRQFGSQFDARTGIVRFEHPQRLRPGLKEIPAGRADDPHVAFFLSHNPGHDRGDELVCLTEITVDNLTRAGQRMMRPPP